MKCKECQFLNSCILRSIIIGTCALFFGCVSTSTTEQEIFMGEGFRSSLPQQGTRVAVWGNHAGAVSRTIGWLHDHQILAVDPARIEKELHDPGFARRTRTEKKAQVLEAAQAIGTPLVLFAQVEDSQLGRTFDFMSFDHKRLKIIGVEIRGMETKSGAVVFGAKAWNSEPLVESDLIVQDLMTFALQKAWNEPGQSLAPQLKVEEKKPKREKVIVVTSHPEEVPQVSEDHQSQIVTPQPQPELVDTSDPEPARVVSEDPQSQIVTPQSQPEPVLVDTSDPESARVVSKDPQSQIVTPQSQPEPGFVDTSDPEPARVVSEDPQAEMAEPLLSEDEPSLGLQVASGALSLFYTPVKIVYAGLGGFFGGLTYLLTAGNEQAAQPVWDASLNGTYWLQGKHLQGKEAIHFKGEPSPIDPIHQARVDEPLVP